MPEKIIRQADAAVERARKIADTEQYTIRVGTSLLNPCTPLIDLWSQVQEEDETFRMQLIPFEDNDERILGLISSLGKGIDIIVGACGSLEWRYRYSFYPLGRYRLFAVLPRKHRLTSRDRLEVSNLHEKSSVMRAAGDVPKLDALRRMLETEHLQIEIINTAYFCDATVFDACVHI